MSKIYLFTYLWSIKFRVELIDWMVKKWLMEFHTEKCKVHHGYYNQYCSYHMNHRKLTVTKQENNLGVTFNSFRSIDTKFPFSQKTRFVNFSILAKVIFDAFYS